MRRPLPLALLSIGTLFLSFAAYELVVGVQVRWGGLALPPRHLQALLAVALAMLATSLLLRARWHGPGGRALMVGLLAAAAMLANTRQLGSGDTLPAAYLPFAIIRTHALTFEKLAQTEPCLNQPERSPRYWFVEREGHLVSKYPLTTGLLALLVELPSTLGSFSPCAPDFHDLEKFAAVVLSAIGVAFMFLTFEKLSGPRPAVLAALLYVLATPVLPILGQALWQHVGACLGLSLSAFGLFGMPSSARRTSLVAFGAGLAVACRPPDVLLAAGFAAALLVEERRHHTAWLAGLPPLAVLAVCNWATLGSPLATGYGEEGTHGWTAFWPEGAAGLLVSPARGLLLLYPILFFAITFLVFPATDPLRKRQLRLMVMGALGYFALMAKWWAWSGGSSPAPRMLADALPILGLGLALAAQWVLAPGRQRWWFASAACLSALCACLVTYVPGKLVTRQRVHSLSEGPWSWRAYPPAAYLLGVAGTNDAPR